MFGFLKKENINEGIDEFNATTGAILLDVRTSDEYRRGHIPGSMNIDVNEIKKTASSISDKATPIFVYCHSGSRSEMAVSALKGMGYTGAKSIGGISSFKGALETDA